MRCHTGRLFGLYAVLCDGSIYLNLTTYGKDWERANNLWKGNNPRPAGKVCVTLPPNDWLCQ